MRPVAARYDREQEFPWEVIEAAAKEGFYNPLFYRDLIGDPTGLSLPLFMEELFWGCAGIGLAVVMPGLALSAMAQAATPEQLLRWAPECFGEPGDLKLAALAISEPEGGSDVRNLRTTRAPRRRRVGDRRPQDVDRQRRHRERPRRQRDRRPRARPPRPGAVRRARRHARPGARAQARQARLPRLAHRGAALRGRARAGRPPARRRRQARGARWSEAREGRGGDSATLGAFEQTRPMVAAQALGIARAALEYATGYATEREAFGGPIIDKQGISFPLADLAADLDAARLLTWRAAWMAANRVPFQHAEGSMSKLKASEVAVRATEQAIQTCGGWGYISDQPVEKWYRDAKLYTIFEGTSEIQRMVIGRALGESAGELPLHHGFPADGPPLSRQFGRGTPRRSQGRDGGAEVHAADARAGAARGDEGARAARARAAPLSRTAPAVRADPAPRVAFPGSRARRGARRPSRDHESRLLPSPATAPRGRGRAPRGPARGLAGAGRIRPRRAPAHGPPRRRARAAPGGRARARRRRLARPRADPRARARSTAAPPRSRRGDREAADAAARPADRRHARPARRPVHRALDRGAAPTTSASTGSSRAPTRPRAPTATSTRSRPTSRTSPTSSRTSTAERETTATSAGASRSATARSAAAPRRRRGPHRRLPQGPRRARPLRLRVARRGPGHASTRTRSWSWTTTTRSTATTTRWTRWR